MLAARLVKRSAAPAECARARVADVFVDVNVKRTATEVVSSRRAAIGAERQQPIGGGGDSVRAPALRECAAALRGIAGGVLADVFVAVDGERCGSRAAKRIAADCAVPIADDECAIGRNRVCAGRLDAGIHAALRAAP